ncbi:MAG: tRNA lysidine(34) synthetase TilS [Dehalococcoidia bacterium]
MRKHKPPPLTDSRFTRSLDKRVLSHAHDRDLFGSGQRVIVAVSGGQDSTALLLILHRLADRLPLSITVGHFDHQLRSTADADADREFVRALSVSLAVPAQFGSADVRSIARRQKLSIEDAARRERYAFLGARADELGAASVVVGHTLDDRAETVLLHLIRGSGIEGLSAMAAQSPWPFGEGPRIIRPLLMLRREETLRYCRESGVEPRADATNDLPIATRNRVRAELVPLLRTFNPRIDEALVRLASSLVSDARALAAIADAEWERLAEVRRGSIRFSHQEISSLDPAITSRLIQRAAREIGPEAPAALHIEQLQEALKRPRSEVSLPGGLTGSVNGQWLTIKQARMKTIVIARTPLETPGSVVAGPWTLSCEVFDAARLPAAAERCEAHVDAASIQGGLVVRARRPGDRLRPLGLGGEKKLQDILVDAKIPASDRDVVPLVADDQGIVWVAGHCIDERVRITPATKRTLHLTLRPAAADEA